MIVFQKSVRNTACEFCPIKGTEYCHKINPMAKKYTRSEKKMLREAMDEGQTAFKEVK